MCSDCFTIPNQGIVLKICLDAPEIESNVTKISFTLDITDKRLVLVMESIWNPRGGIWSGHRIDF